MWNLDTALCQPQGGVGPHGPALCAQRVWVWLASIRLAGATHMGMASIVGGAGPWPVFCAVAAPPTGGCGGVALGVVEGMPRPFS